MVEKGDQAQPLSSVDLRDVSVYAKGLLSQRIRRGDPSWDDAEGVEPESPPWFGCS